MAYRVRRTIRRRQFNEIHDHTVFVLVILLAAAFYAHKESFHWKPSVVNIIFGVLVLTLLVLFIKLLKKTFLSRSLRHASPLMIDKMSGVKFERYVASLLPKQGYNHIWLTEHYDLGIDIIAEKDDVVWGIQIKRHNSPVKMAAVRQAVAALKHYDCDRAMVITNSAFTNLARDLAESNSCTLVDGRQLLRWAQAI